MVHNNVLGQTETVGSNRTGGLSTNLVFIMQTGTVKCMFGHDYGSDIGTVGSINFWTQMQFMGIDRFLHKL